MLRILYGASITFRFCNVRYLKKCTIECSKLAVGALPHPPVNANELTKRQRSKIVHNQMKCNENVTQMKICSASCVYTQRELETADCARKSDHVTARQDRAGRCVFPAFLFTVKSSYMSALLKIILARNSGIILLIQPIRAPQEAIQPIER